MVASICQKIKINFNMRYLVIKYLYCVVNQFHLINVRWDWYVNSCFIWKSCGIKVKITQQYHKYIGKSSYFQKHMTGHDQSSGVSINGL